jgi:hypothetical protein
MDQRCEPRFAADQSVTITALGENQFRQTAKVRNASGSGLGLVVETEISPGTALRIEWEDAFVLGEVMYCRPMENGHFVGVQLEQMLHGLSDLRRRFRAFREETWNHRIETP